MFNRHTPFPRSALAAASLALLSATTQAADGLQFELADAWPVWQARIHLGLEASAEGGLRTRQSAMLGDYYLQRHGNDDRSARWRGGFRATGGVVVGGLGLPGDPSTLFPGATAAPAEWGLPERDAWPYIGFGYSGLAPRGGWGFSADLGIAIRQPAAAVDLGRAVLTLRGWDEAIRRLDPLPMLQLGVRYTF